MKNLNIFSSIIEYENTKSEGVLNAPNVSFVDEDSSVRYLLEFDPYNGYDYIDLGLSVKWATCNVGASSPEEYGLYFAWGETTGYTGEQVTSGVRAFTQEEYNAGSAASISADLTLEQDAAHVNFGGRWRMPTKDEYQELFDKCNGVWTNNYNGTGVKGCVFTSKVNGNSVFFPAAGYYSFSDVTGVGDLGQYWSASLDTYYGKYLNFTSGYKSVGNSFREYGLTVRAVCE